MRAILFLTISFSALWTNQAAAADQPPVTILSAWIGPNPNPKSILTVVNAEPGIPMHIVETLSYDNEPMAFVKIRTNTQCRAASVLIRMFDASGKEISSGDNKKSFDFESHKSGIVTMLSFRLPEDREITMVSLCFANVRLMNGTIWRPPTDHPITFEARLKTDEKSEKKADEKAGKAAAKADGKKDVK